MNKVLESISALRRATMWNHFIFSLNNNCGEIGEHSSKSFFNYFSLFSKISFKPRRKNMCVLSKLFSGKNQGKLIVMQKFVFEWAYFDVKFSIKITFFAEIPRLGNRYSSRGIFSIFFVAQSWGFFEGIYRQMTII